MAKVQKAYLGRVPVKVYVGDTIVVDNVLDIPYPPIAVGDDVADLLTAYHEFLPTSEIVMSVADGAYVAYAPVTIGNVARAAGYVKYKIKATSTRTESSVTLSPEFTLASVVVTPAPPLMVGNDQTDILTISHPLGISEVLMRVNGGTWVQALSQIDVGNNARPEGYWETKVKAGVNRTESSIAKSPIFTSIVIATTPVKPEFVGDDLNDKLYVSHPTLGLSEILISENNGPWVQAISPVDVGNNARLAGYWRAKTKAATNRNESDIAFSPAFTVAAVTPTGPAYYISASGVLGNSGTSASSPWPFSKLQNPGGFTYGDTIRIETGSTYVGQINIGGYFGGDPTGKTITYESYGTGAKPIITTRVPIPGSATPANWVQVATNVWKIVLANNYWSGNNPRIWFNGVEASKATAIATVNNTNKFFRDYTTENIYVYSVGNPATVNLSLTSTSFVYQSVIKIDGQENVVIRNLDLRGGKDTVIDLAFTKFTIDNCNIGLEANRGGVRVNNTTYGLIKNNVCDTGAYTLSNYYVAGDGGDGIQLDGGNISNVEVFGNSFYNWLHGALWIEQRKRPDGTIPVFSNISFHDNFATAPNLCYGRAFGCYGYLTNITNISITNNRFVNFPIQNQIACPNLTISGNTIDGVLNGVPTTAGHETGMGNGLQIGHFYYVAQNMAILNNDIRNCEQTGLAFSGEQNYDVNTTNALTKNNRVEGNTFTNNGYNVLNPWYETNRTLAKTDIHIYDRFAVKNNTFKNNVHNRAATDKCIFYGHDPLDNYAKTVTEFNGANGTAGDVISGNSIALT